jgi:2-oxoglutarate ferredoxin oxidoreductase subunit gamma
MFDKKLADVLVRAIEQPGFAMCDVWELCTAYYSPRNEVKKSELYELLDRYGFELGLLVDKPRPEYSCSYREAFAKSVNTVKPRVSVEKKYSNSLAKQTGIVIAGSAGQKIKSTATIFAKAAMSGGLEVTQKDDYPITVKTGHSLAEIIISPERIDYTAIESPDYFILISEDGLKRARKKIEALSATCLVFAEESLEVPKTQARVIKIPMASVAKKTGKTTIGVVALAAMLARTDLFPAEAFQDAIARFQKPKISQANLAAFAAGVGLAAT